MAELVIVLALSCIILVYSAYYAARPVVSVEKRQMERIDTETLCDILREKAKELRICEQDSLPIRKTEYFSTIGKAQKMLTKKVRGKIPLSDAEKWYYENYYLLHRTAFSKGGDLKGLPHVDGTPRILTIARTIVDGSLGDLSPEKLRAVLWEAQKEVPFTFRELTEMENAVSVALLENAYVLAGRLLYIDACKKAAEKKKIVDSFLTRDAYVYYLWKRAKTDENLRKELERRGWKEERFLAGFTALSLKNTLIAETVFRGIADRRDLFPFRTCLRFSGAYQAIDRAFPLGDVSEETVTRYLSRVEKFARKNACDETYAAERAVMLAKRLDTDVSFVLLDGWRAWNTFTKTSVVRSIKKKKGRVALYAIGSVLLSTAGVFTVWFISRDYVVSILAAIPLFFLAESVIRYFASVFLPQRLPPSNNAKTVSYENATLIVISEYVSGIDTVKASIRHAQTVLSGEPDENVSVALLMDTKGSDVAISDEDREIIDYLEKNDFGDRLSFFIRKKCYKNERFVSKERKRGAILALCKYLVTKEDFEFLYVKSPRADTPRFLVLLDADNTLLPGEVLRAVNVMTHPYNDAYDIAAFGSRVDLYSVGTHYARRFINDGGFEGYPVYSDLFRRFFGESIFCGKGIVRLQAFYNAFEGVFPSERILSHDILEGSVLHTTQTGMCFEDAPKNFISDRERQRRWERGDVQLIPFAFGRWKTDEKERYGKRLSAIGRYTMFTNPLRLCKEMFLFALFLYGVCTGRTNLLCFVAVYALPYLLEEIKILRNNVAGMRVGDILVRTARNAYKAVEDFFLLGFFAVDRLRILLQTVCKMLLKKNLLEWKTYGDSQKQYRFGSYVRLFGIPFAVLTALCSGVFWGGFPDLILPVYLVGYFLMIPILFASGFSVEEKNVSEEDRAYLRRLAENTYAYFCFMRRENGLIGDHLQVCPYKGEGKITSPTNLGFSLLAELCAHSLGLISFAECESNVGVILTGLENLPKRNGNFYNWYDVETEKPVKAFVSSVDNGNLAAALLVTISYMRRSGAKELSERAEKLWKDLRLTDLYDENKNLFYIGFDGKEYVGHYDLLASEARILSVVYMAKEGNARHYYALNKDFSPIGGNTLLSWGGTAFEMLMPDLFFPSPYGSMMDASIRSTVTRQKKGAYRGVWGTSESGYYAFDEEGNYQYAAFGRKELALSTDVKEDVIAPYASVMALRYRPKDVVRNLKRLSALGASFTYGLYESVDFSDGTKVVRSAMSHHHGMILVALANYLNNDVIRNAFTDSPAIRNVLGYFNERRPTRRMYTAWNGKREKYVEPHNQSGFYLDNVTKTYCTTALTDGRYSVILSAIGAGYSRCGDVFCNRFGGVYGDNDGMFFYASKDGVCWNSPTFLPRRDSSIRYTFASDGKTAEYVGAGLRQSVALLAGLCGEVRKLRAEKGYGKVAFYFDLCLDTADGYASHPAFKDLFVKTTLIRDTVLLVERRVVGKRDESTFLAVRVDGVRNVVWNTDRLTCVGRGNTAAGPVFLQGSTTRVGDVLCPCVGMKADFAPGIRECRVTIVYGENREEVLRTIFALPEDAYRYALETDGQIGLPAAAQKLLGDVLYVPYDRALLDTVARHGKSAAFYAFSSGKKILRYEVDEEHPEKILPVLSGVAALRAVGLPVKLSMLLSTGDRDVKDYLMKEIAEHHLQTYAFVTEEDREKDWFWKTIPSDGRYTESRVCRVAAWENKKIVRSTPVENELVYRTGSGGYNARGEYVVTGRTRLPYTQVIGYKKGGAVITDDGTGFYYFRNSREEKAVRFENDPVGERKGEIWRIEGSDYVAYPAEGATQGGCSIFGKGISVKRFVGEKFRAVVSEYMLCDGDVKVAEWEIEKDVGEYLELSYSFYPCLSWKYDPTFLAFSVDKDVVSVQNVATGRAMYVRLIGFDPTNVTVSEDCDVPRVTYTCAKNMEKVWVCSSYDLSVLLSLRPENVGYLKESAIRYFEEMSRVDVVSGERPLNYLVNRLAYQTLSSRLHAKAGFYQVGGATGFRDQLQDALAFFTRPEILRERIEEACRHQYEEGDVMHWWHEPRYGLRTRITDDKLFLPYAVAEYVRYTQDEAFLDETFPYLTSAPLAPTEEDRFEFPDETSYEESVRSHCKKAIRSALKYGEHRLLVMGSGDWNDGMNAACKQGKGESVCNSMFAYLVIRRFAEVCDDGTREELLSIADDLKNAVNTFAYEEGQYKRLFTDDGKWLGSARSEALQIDLLSQAFAVLSGVAEGERAIRCLHKAQELFDETAGAIRLLRPDCTRKEYLGYISDYPEGVRENGGQYTHAAMWYLMALTKMGRCDEAYELFDRINPVKKCSDPEKAEQYGGEPYVLSGDVYTNRDNYGRCGWSWYTGSAAWAYKLVVEWFFGWKIRGDKLYIEPCLPKRLAGSVLVFRYKNSSYVIEYREGLYPALTVQGENAEYVVLEENVRKNVTVQVAF